MTLVFLATLGTRPAAITIALDKLRDQYAYAAAGILYTSGIEEARAQLAVVLDVDYPALPVRWHEMTRADGRLLLDIEDQADATAYWRGVYAVLRDHAIAGHTVHLLIAGGRKAMSVYAAMAAALTFGAHDRLFTVLSPENLVERTDQYHIPPGLRDQVQVVALPVLPLRLPPGEAARLLPDDPQALIDARRSPAAALRASMTPEETRLAEMVCEHPYASSKALAAMLGKSHRTVERQLQDIYARMMNLFDLPGPVQPQHKRKLLVDMLREG
ncbi:MAG: hypothetical protein JNL34_01065 [Anaerolineae bacterium]|nr:hypothetical protein [Anaerolineae bacterium]